MCFVFMIRDESLLVSLRPELALPNQADMSDLEKFQNDTLRPVLKLQHELLIAHVNTNPHFKKIKPLASSPDDYKARVIAFMKQQASLKNQIIGLIVGHFTLKEFGFYSNHCGEVNKRILQMAGERVAVWM